MAAVPAYSITTDAIAEEQKRSGGDLSVFDVGNVIQLDTLDLPDLMQASYDRSPAETNNIWQGSIPDRDIEVTLPRLKEIWR